MSKISLVTSFRGDFWNVYAKECLESFDKYWPKNIKMYAYYNDWAERGLHIGKYDPKRIEFIDLTDRSTELCAFFKKYKDNPDNKPNWRTDVKRWAYKVYTEYDFFVKNPPKSDIGIWIDADTVTYNTIPMKKLNEWLPKDKDVAVLGREAVNYIEAGFVAMRMTDLNKALFADMFGVWNSGEIFNYKEWHDAFVLTRIMNLHQAHGLQVYNLSPHCADLNAFEASPLVRYMYHNKGLLKFKKESDAQAPDTKVQYQKPNSTKKPIVVTPQDCMPIEDIRMNIMTNAKRIKSTIQKCRWNDEEVAIVSAGPSLKKSFKELHQLQDRKVKIVCVKHSHNTLLENGILPWACTILDPRPFEEKSTHGFVRKELLAEPHPRVKYLVATMSNPDVVTHLLDKKADVVAWDAYCNAIEGWDFFKGKLLITGGTCAGMRTIGMLHTLGFRTVHLYGFDSCIDGEPENKDELAEDGRKKWLKVSVGSTNKSYWTTGELLAQAQDFEKLMQREEIDLDIVVHGDGLIPALWEDGLKDRSKILSYRELFDDLP
tara:strand:+ start:1818 stop:3449 length:1632 start_codon:yes stop_codon:yes gene_type:complete